jgi:thiamine biosynthesis lipoprotein
MNDAPLSRREMLKRAGEAASVVPLLGLSAVCNAEHARDALTRLDGATMGTTWSVKIAGNVGRVDLRSLQADIERVLERVNEQMSTYRADSELARFNASGTTGWFEVSCDTWTVFEQALRVSRVCGGAFDVTVAPLVNAWGFGPPDTSGAWRRQPDTARIVDLLERVDYTALRTRRSPPAVARNRPGVGVDLGGIAKGFGLDQVATCLEQAGLERYLVEIGGELRACGSGPRGGPWLVGIERPVVGQPAVYRVVRLESRAIATSGDYRLCFEREGVRYSHLIDPRTGRPVAHGLASVSVVAETAMVADAMSTALMVMGLDAGYRLAERLLVAAMFIGRQGRDLVARHTPEFDRFLVGAP